MRFDETRNSYPYRIRLFLLGGMIEVQCRFKQCAEEIRNYFVTAVCDDRWLSPDVIVKCDTPEAGRYLFRTRPKECAGLPLEGIAVLTSGDAEPQPWMYVDPPLPPFRISPFRDRFVGLHAGAVETSSGHGLLIIGSSGSGKTTTTLELVRNHRCGLLTDETVFIHRRSRLIEPFPRIILARERDEQGKIAKIAIPATEACERICDQPVVAQHAIFLEPTSVGIPVMRTISPAEMFRKLIPHHLDVGCTSDEAIVTLTLLAQSVAGTVLSYSSYHDLVKIIPNIPMVATNGSRP